VGLANALDDETGGADGGVKDLVNPNAAAVLDT